MAPAILPLHPAPATLPPLLAETEDRGAGGDAGHALGIGVGVASGSIVVATYLRHRERFLEQVARAMSDGALRLRRWRRQAPGQKCGEEHACRRRERR